MINTITTRRVAGRQSYREIGDAVYNGEFLLFDRGGGKLIKAARQLCRRVFETSAIEKAHEKYKPKDFLVRAAEAQREFNQPPYKQHFADWLRAVGIEDQSDVYWDALGLRIAAPVDTHAGGFRSHVGVHRDTWGAGIQSQINWWAPIMPLSYGRTMAFYPHYWQRALGNTTAQWSFEDYLAARREVKKQGRAAGYPPAPTSTEAPATPPYLVRPRCGELLAFSAAHLHTSVENRTRLTRYSLEIRTVHRADVRRQRGAPNVDCDSHPPLYRLFSRVGGDERLQEAL